MALPWRCLGGSGCAAYWFAGMLRGGAQTLCGTSVYGMICQDHSEKSGASGAIVLQRKCRLIFVGIRFLSTKFRTSVAMTMLSSRHYYLFASPSRPFRMAIRPLLHGVCIVFSGPQNGCLGKLVDYQRVVKRLNLSYFAPRIFFFKISPARESVGQDFSMDFLVGPTGRERQWRQDAVRRGWQAVATMREVGAPNYLM